MKRAVLYVCHGSRLVKAREEAVAFIKRCQKHVEADIQEISFLELASPSIEEGFRACVDRGATHLTVVPLLLLTAVHAKKDIPDEIQRCMGLYPHIRVKYGRPIGVHERMVESVINKIEEAAPRHPLTTVILIGRGSSDPDVKTDLSALAELVHRKTAISEVRTCYLTAASPSFTETLESLKNTEGNVVFVPYLLFTGLLMKGIEKEIRRTHNQHILLANYLGYDPLVEQAFLDRVNESLWVKGEDYAANHD
ncbi:sirohydrochlorin chelatase [Rossellomorea sp. KS-H15a]|uniref:sirohydrochlorin chelatase n=1 Tax=Rossellomorea sp. KS-H15a TaxID=2963940 RepID=UPI0020C640E9|nr:sirohydrochlorin chelatase [Rossellomorea sp. KS-H15a]UTE75806.1 sirohydrochlorin chelatase [Rossellomorea sp. KS-H15a]